MYKIGNKNILLCMYSMSEFRRSFISQEETNIVSFHFHLKNYISVRSNLIAQMIEFYLYFPCIIRPWIIRTFHLIQIVGKELTALCGVKLQLS